MVHNNVLFACLKNFETLKFYIEGWWIKILMNNIKKYNKDYLALIKPQINNFKIFLRKIENMYYQNVDIDIYKDYLNKNFSNYEYEELVELGKNANLLFLMDLTKYANPDLKIFECLNSLMYENLMLLHIPIKDLTKEFYNILNENDFEILYKLYLSLVEFLPTNIINVKIVTNHLYENNENFEDRDNYNNNNDFEDDEILF